jgi:hypothetical protein
MAKNRLEDELSEEEDPSGARGMARAEFKLRKQGYPSVSPRPIKEIIKHTPKDISGDPRVNSLAKSDLSNLKKAGYNVNLDYFEKQDNTGKWNYYMKVLGDNGYSK